MVVGDGRCIRGQREGGKIVVAAAAAALSPWTFDPGHTGSPAPTFSNGVLHLAKNCPTATNASAGATITGVSGQTFTSASFTLPNTCQCQGGGSPRFNVVAGGTTFFLGCNNVAPTGNSDGSVTYTFTAATIAAAGNQGQSESMLAGRAPNNQCKHGGWRTFTSRSFKNQGQCLKSVKGHSSHGHGHGPHH
jgi:hypothetical protein